MSGPPGIRSDQMSDHDPITESPRGDTAAGAGGEGERANRGGEHGLPQPLRRGRLQRARATDGRRAGVFRVTGNSGGLVSGSAALGTVAVPTNAQGEASARCGWGRARAWGHIVEANGGGVRWAGDLQRSATSGMPAQMVVDTGNGQIGAVGKPCRCRSIAIVTDERHNRLPAVAGHVTVKQGGRPDRGQATFSTVSDGDGRVAAVLTLGHRKGRTTHRSKRRLWKPGESGGISGVARVPGNPANTRITGVVLDNSNHAIPGVTMRVFRTHNGPGLPEQVTTPVVTDAQGQFTILPAPGGEFKLMADGSTAPGGRIRHWNFDITTVAGQNNDVGLRSICRIWIRSNQLCVTETTGGTLTLPQVPGFA